MKTYLIIGVFACIPHLTVADTKLSNKALIQLESAQTKALLPSLPSKKQTTKLEKTTAKSESTSEKSSEAPSKLESIVKQAKYISEGAGVLGENLKTVIKKDVVGIKYTTNW